MSFSRQHNRDWALVTGGSRGIGLALARGLAERGYSLVLVGRSAARLAVAREELRRGGAREVVCLECDLSCPDAAAMLYGECRRCGVEVDVLVNNAGQFAYCDLDSMEPSRVASILSLHVVVTTELCRLFGGDMARRGGGYILNMSSYASWLPLGGLSLYGPTKAFVRDFSYALREELMDQGVVVTAVMPAGVATDLYGLSARYQRLGLRLGVLMSPERAARRALRGLFAGRRRVVPGVVNRLVRPIVSHLPLWVKRAIRKKTLGIQK